MSNTQLTISLDKVIYCRYWYENVEGQSVKCKPSQPSVRGVTFNPNAFASYHQDYPLETLMERAIRLDILDTWTPVCLCKTVSGKSVTYQGAKATKIWETYNAMIFNRGKPKNN